MFSQMKKKKELWMIFWIFKTFAHEIASHKNRRENNFDQSQKLDH